MASQADRIRQHVMERYVRPFLGRLAVVRWQPAHERMVAGKRRIVNHNIASPLVKLTADPAGGRTGRPERSRAWRRNENDRKPTAGPLLASRKRRRLGYL